MNLSSVLGILVAGGVGAVAGGTFGIPFLSKVPTHEQESNQQPESFPQIQAKEEKAESVLTFDDSLNKDQTDVLKKLWSQGDNSTKYLIDYFDYEGWMSKARQYSLLSDKWPGDIIFIKDKSDKNLGEKLRNKCYSAAQWFFTGSRSNNNIDVKDFMKDVHGNFYWERAIDLCATDTGTLPENIEVVVKKTLSSAGAEAYTCKIGVTINEQWIKDVLEVKKENSGTECEKIKGSVVMEIEYKDKTKKYQLLKSRKSSNGNLEAIPGDGKIYSSILEIPGLSDLFEPSKK